MVKISKEAALEYHESGRPGKIEVKPTKAYRTQTDLSLAYSPGVAYPCLEIQQNPDDAYKYNNFLFCILLRVKYAWRKVPSMKLHNPGQF